MLLELILDALIFGNNLNNPRKCDDACKYWIHKGGLERLVKKEILKKISLCPTFFIFSQNGSPSEIMLNAFYFI